MIKVSQNVSKSTPSEAGLLLHFIDRRMRLPVNQSREPRFEAGHLHLKE